MRVPFSIVICLTTVWGFQHFQDEIPNGKNVPHPCKASHMWKGVGHFNPLGGGSPNQFGIDFYNAGKIWTKTFCVMDSDNDGKTNGEELGDPKCVWTKGNAPPITVGITHPGICTPFSDSKCSVANSWIKCDDDDGFHCDALNGAGIKSQTIRFPETAVPTESKSHYCMQTDLPTDGDYQMVATKPYLSNDDDVVHEILLYGCDETSSTSTFPKDIPRSCTTGIHQQCNVLIGKWTDGLSGECLQKGFLIGRSGFRKAVLRIQWHEKVQSSFGGSFGLTLYYTPKLSTHDANIITDIAISPGQTTAGTGGAGIGAASVFVLITSLVACSLTVV
ncbi:uncharacterized protein [Argopecten irradians]|uniref:uncharacterized protein n=1 Tax=Argopecten irradians TaxID=31199 RepID=UPI003714505A